MNNKICIVGWHFYPDFYKYLAKYYKKETYIVAHRYNKILDEYKLNYTVTKNVGLEFGAYDWYIKNEWDKKNGVLFMHDDIKIKNINIFDDIFNKVRKLDLSYCMGRKESTSRKKSTTNSQRCFYLSSKLINLLLKEYNGIWYDVHNRGYTLGENVYYDSVYTKEYKDIYCKEIGRSFKKNTRNLIKKYNLTFKNIIIKDLILKRRGGIDIKDEIIGKSLNDNSIFGRVENELEKIALKYDVKKSQSKHYYTKWYNFYFLPVRFDNLNILEIGVASGKSLMMWKKYFSNSNIYGVEIEKSVINKELTKDCKIFIGNQVDKEFLKKVCKKVSLGFDIIIDNGSNFARDQVFTFQYLFNKLNPGGIYIIEDLQKSYREKYKKESHLPTIEYFKKIIDDINYNGKFKLNSFERIIRKTCVLKKYERLITGVSFHAGICFIFKRFCR